MSAAKVKLSPAVKALISAPHSLGSAIPAPPKAKTAALFNNIRSRGESNGLGPESWLALSTAALVTINSPAAVCDLFTYAAEQRSDIQDQVKAATVMRETALKCIGFSGIPRTINALTALRAHLPDPVKEGLSTEPTRIPKAEHLNELSARGRRLWDSIYEPQSVKLLSKLSDAHPDLPVHILNSHYGPLFSDPWRVAPQGHFKVGRILTSVVAMACLRAQQGVALQLTSHVFGLKKALLEGGGAEGEEERVHGEQWLASDEGVTWILESTDEISDVIAGERTTFAGPMKAKL